MTSPPNDGSAPPPGGTSRPSSLKAAQSALSRELHVFSHRNQLANGRTDTMSPSWDGFPGDELKATIKHLCMRHGKCGLPTR